MYGQKFKELLMATVKGFGIGLILSILLLNMTKMAQGTSQFVGYLIVFTILIGSCASIIICSKSGVQGFLSGAVSHIWNGIENLFFGSIFGGNIYFLVFGLIRFVIGVIIMIPVAIYMAVSYFLNLIYYGIMALLERNNKLDDKSDLCEKLDKLVPVMSFVIVAFFCFLIVNAK